MAQDSSQYPVLPLGLKTAAGLMEYARAGAPPAQRPLRVDELGTLRTTAETVLWEDGFEGANINALWTQAVTGMTIVQANGVLRLNNNLSVANNNAASITSLRQFQKLPGQILAARFRVRFGQASASGLATISFGFGSPAGDFSIPDGIIMTATVGQTPLVSQHYLGATQAQGPVNTGAAIVAGTWYNFDLYIGDSFFRMVVSDVAGSLYADNLCSLDGINGAPATATPRVWQFSHLPVFAQVANLAAVAVAGTLDLALQSVVLLDASTNMPFSDQQALCGRQANLNPLDQSQTAQAANAAPAGGTPSNGAALYTTLGGDYIATLTATAEDILSLFAYTVPSPYSFLLTGLVIPAPLVSTAWNIAGTIPALEWFLVANCASANLGTGGGQRMSLGLNPGTALNAAAGTQMGGGPFVLTLKTPILCLSGTVLHIGWKVLFGGAVTAGAVRGSVVVDGYFL